MDEMDYNAAMSGLIDQIRPKLQEGFTLEFHKGGKGKGKHRLYKNGRPYKWQGFGFVTINDDDQYSYRRDTFKMLEKIGAIDVLKDRTPKHRPSVEETTRRRSARIPIESGSIKVKTGMDRALAIKQDHQSSPRERGMANAYMDLKEEYDDLKEKYARAVKLAEGLAERLRGQSD